MTLYELQPNLTLTENYRAISRAQLDLAIESLTETQNLEKGIYSARKCMKRLRGLLQLYRDVLASHEREEDRPFEALNKRYRDIGRALSDLRDAWVLIELIDKLPDDVRELPIVPVLRAYFVQQYEHKKETFLKPETYEPVIQQLKAAKKALKYTYTFRWSDRFDDGCVDPRQDELYRVIPLQMKATAAARRRARAAYHRSFEQYVVNLHEWRKRVKRLWYAFTLLRPVDPQLLDEWISWLDEMGVMLGDANDCHVLYETIVVLFNWPRSFGDYGGSSLNLAPAAHGSALFTSLVEKLAELHQSLEIPPITWLRSLPPASIKAEADAIPVLLKHLRYRAAVLFKQAIEKDREFKCSHRPSLLRRRLALGIERTFNYDENFDAIDDDHEANGENDSVLPF